ncbi:hypothetical protein O181_044749 [Austropuccinia psidii MF-1]|uniref:Uncharacterized protein n=1 Tax=Austropuccinia psidii MF-1 TaxID=1389203 RepID=A0A9Q3DKV2_9BASI|nr:hypothetical protein [Austropuccinia psidii MF-1]
MVAISNGHFNIPTSHHVIKAPNHSEESSRLKSKCSASKTNDAIKQSLVILTPSIPSKGILSIHSQSVFKRQCQKKLSSVKAPLNPSWQPYSFQYSLDPSRTVFHFQEWEIHSTQFNFNISQLYQFPKQSIQPQGSIQISFQPEELKLPTFHIYRLPFPPWGVFPS